MSCRERAPCVRCGACSGVADAWGNPARAAEEGFAVARAGRRLLRNACWCSLLQRSLVWGRGGSSRG